jgi:hypothetical protein
MRRFGQLSMLAAIGLACPPARPISIPGDL